MTDQKLCPFLTVGSLQMQTVLKMAQPTEPGLVGVQGQINFITCQREKCGLWVESGNGTDGQCALAALGAAAAASGPESFAERVGNLAGAVTELVDALPESVAAENRRTAALEKLAEERKKK